MVQAAGTTYTHTRRPIVAVVGSGTEEVEERSSPLGRMLALRGVHLLTGGGGGVMEAVSRAFHGVVDRRGLILGILPAGTEAVSSPPPGYPNPWVEVPVQTHLPLRGEEGSMAMSRNHLVVLSADVVIVLPGGAGTASEAHLAVQYARPVVGFLDHRGEVPGLSDEIPLENTVDGVQRVIDKTL